jgi:hypothetical protein
LVKVDGAVPARDEFGSDRRLAGRGHAGEQDPFHGKRIATPAALFYSGIARRMLSA